MDAGGFPDRARVLSGPGGGCQGQPEHIERGIGEGLQAADAWPQPCRINTRLNATIGRLLHYMQ